jgi:hypothetical protein
VLDSIETFPHIVHELPDLAVQLGGPRVARNVGRHCVESIRLGQGPIWYQGGRR